jgi:hypothetical protein
MTPPEEFPDWERWRELLLDNIRELKEGQGEARRELVDFRKEVRDTHDAVRAKLSSLETEVTVIKVKAGLFGMVAGAIPATVAFVIDHLAGPKR